tara:strand:- start:1919 stop:2209 length:291 start_codon:yes stop_codon:yes gene_type:complete
MFWAIYILSATYFCYVLANLNTKFSSAVFLFFLIALLTPARLEVSNLEYAPSLFTYIFNVVFEQNFSTRILRPLALTLPFGILTFVFYKIIKRKFF